MTDDRELIRDLYRRYWRCMIQKDAEGLRGLMAEDYSLLQMGFAVIPGSRNVAHIRDNLDILDFTLTDGEMAEIAKLDKGVRYYHRTDAQLVQFAAWQPTYEAE